MAKRYDETKPRERQEKRLADWLESREFPGNVGVFERLSRAEAEYLAEELMRSGFILPLV